MSVSIYGPSCEPGGQPLPFGLGVTPEPTHDRCPGGWSLPGVIGGWSCRCECHLAPKGGSLPPPEGSAMHLIVQQALERGIGQAVIEAAAGLITEAYSDPRSSLPRAMPASHYAGMAEGLNWAAGWLESLGQGDEITGYIRANAKVAADNANLNRLPGATNPEYDRALAEMTCDLIGLSHDFRDDVLQAIRERAGAVPYPEVPDNYIGGAPA